MAKPGRSIQVRPPAPTAFQASDRIVRLIASIAFAQFLLSGLQNVLGGRVMLVAWLVGGVAVTMATIRFERYFFRKGGLR